MRRAFPTHGVSEPDLGEESDEMPLRTHADWELAPDLVEAALLVLWCRGRMEAEGLELPEHAPRVVGSLDPFDEFWIAALQDVQSFRNDQR